MSFDFWKQQVSLRSYEVRYSAIGIAMGVAISATGLVMDSALRRFAGLDASFEATFFSTYMHSFMLSAPIMLGYCFRFVGVWRRELDETLRTSQEIEALAREKAVLDSVTGLFNRSYLMQRLEEGLAMQEWKARNALIFLLDLDDFKLINDTYGHSIGDVVLIEVAKRIRGVCGGQDIAVRLGGDEFVVVHFPPSDDDDVGSVFAAGLIEALCQSIRYGSVHIQPGISVGYARVGRDGMTCSDVLKAADLALYQAKKEAGSRFRMFEPAMRSESDRLLRLESDIRGGIERSEFFLEYQPLYGAESKALRGFEALLRWRHPERGIVSPGEFIPVAESAGLILPLGREVIQAACRAAASWPKPISVSVNLSPVQFNDPDLVDHVRTVLRETGLAPGRLDLEITETFLLEADAKVHAIIEGLKGLGVRITMDDFGTGYSSLSTLKNFPFDRLKIDRSFTRDIGTATETAEIIRTIVRLSHILKLETVLEGVESDAELAFARETGITEVQGFYFSRSMPLEAVEAMLAPKLTSALRLGAA